MWSKRHLNREIGLGACHNPICSPRLRLQTPNKATWGKRYGVVTATARTIWGKTPHVRVPVVGRVGHWAGTTRTAGSSGASPMALTELVHLWVQPCGSCLAGARWGHTPALDTPGYQLARPPKLHISCHGFVWAPSEGLVFTVPEGCHPPWQGVQTVCNG